MRVRDNHQGFDLGSAMAMHAMQMKELRRWMPVWCELGTEGRHTTQCMQPGCKTAPVMHVHTV
jgi:hypothetical protein